MRATVNRPFYLLAAIAVATIAASGCTHTDVKDIVPQDGPTMEQIYDAHMSRIRATEAEGARQELGPRPAADPRPVPVIGPPPQIVPDAGEPGLMKVSLPAGAAHGNTAHGSGAAHGSVAHANAEHGAATPVRAGPPTAATDQSDGRTVIDGAPPFLAVGLRAPEINLAGYTRTAEREIDAIFPRLPNPDLVMYVFPHLAGPDQAPVPGYATSFPLYERVEYALPGEVPAP